MALTKKDFEILDKFEFEIKPVGMKYVVRRPENYLQLDKPLAFCEMLKWAQEGNVFYADVDNHACGAGSYVLGQIDLEEPYISGEYGAGLQAFNGTRAASQIYQHISTIGRGVVNYVIFSPVDKMDFEPDLLIIMAKTNQAEILFRALSYKTGAMWTSKYTPVIGCSWMFIYPYLSGEMNYTTTGLGFGMKRKKLWPEGLKFISFPNEKIPELLQTLEEMPWVPRPFQPDGLEYVKKLRIDLGIDPPD